MSAFRRQFHILILIGLDIEHGKFGGALMVVRFTEVVRFWEGSLREVSLYCTMFILAK